MKVKYLEKKWLVLCAFYIILIFAAGCGRTDKQKADAYLRSKNFDRAIEMYRKALLANPNSSEAHSDLGLACLEKIQDYYNKKLRTAAFAFDRKQLEGAMGEEQRSSAYIFDEALREFEKSLELNPANPFAHYGLGYVYLKRGDSETELEIARTSFKKAVEEFEEAVRLKPDYAQMHLALGLSYASLGSHGGGDRSTNYLDKAIEECEKALTIKPDYRDAAYNLNQLKIIKSALSR